MQYLPLVELFNRMVWPIVGLSVVGFTVSTITGMLLEKRGQMRFVPYLFKATEYFRAMLIGITTMALAVRYILM